MSKINMLKIVFIFVVIFANGLNIVRSEVIVFDEPTDTIKVMVNTVAGTTVTYEAWVFFSPSISGGGYLFNEWSSGRENKVLKIKPNLGKLSGYSYPCGGSDMFTVDLPYLLTDNIWHHIAYVHDGKNEYMYVDGVRNGERTVDSPDVNNHSGLPRIGAIYRSSVVKDGFMGYIDSLRISDNARYTGPTFTVPQRNMPKDPNTVMLFWFNETQGRKTAKDEVTGGYIGKLGESFGEGITPVATSPAFTSVPVIEPIYMKQIYKSYSSAGWVGINTRVGDADNDGLNEIVSTIYRDVAIFSSDGPSFVMDSNWNLGDSVQSAYGIAVGDSDNDGLNEVLIGTWANGVFVYQHEVGEYIEEDHISGIGYGNWSIEIADTDALNGNEVLVGERYGQFRGLRWKSSKYNVFYKSPELSEGRNASVHVLGVGDTNGNAKPNVVTYCGQEGILDIWESDWDDFIHVYGIWNLIMDLARLDGKEVMSKTLTAMELKRYFMLTHAGICLVSGTMV